MEFKMTPHMFVVVVCIPDHTKEQEFICAEGEKTRSYKMKVILVEVKEREVMKKSLKLTQVILTERDGNRE